MLGFGPLASFPVGDAGTRAPVADTLACDGGSFPYTGGDLVLGRSLICDGGSFGHTGGTLAPAFAGATACAAGAFACSGGALAFGTSFHVPLAGGLFTLTGGRLDAVFWQPVLPSAGLWSDVAPVEVTWQ